MSSKDVSVLHIVDSLVPGGTERILVELANALVKRNVSVGVCVTRLNGELAAELDSRIELLVLNRTSTWDVNAIQQLVVFCRTRHVQVLHAHGRSSLKFAALVKLLCARRITLIFHDHYGEIHIDRNAHPSLKWLSRIFADWYVGVSPELREWAVKELGFPRSRSSVLGNAVDLARFQAVTEPLDLSKPSQLFKAAMIANLRPQKDHGLLLESIAGSSFVQSHLHVYLIGLDLGDAYSQYVHHRVGDLSLEANISFLGKHTDIPEILKAVDFGLLCSKSESGPIALLEYLAAELPFLATHTGQIAHKLSAEGHKYYVEPGNVGAFTKALEDMLSLSIEDRQELIKQGRALLRSHFSVQQRAKELIHIYQKLGLCQQAERSHVIL